MMTKVGSMHLFNNHVGLDISFWSHFADSQKKTGENETTHLSSQGRWCLASGHVSQRLNRIWNLSVVAPFCSVNASQLNDVLVLVTAAQLWCMPQPPRIHWVTQSNHGQFKFCGQVSVPGPLPSWGTICPLMQASVEILLLSYIVGLILPILPLQTCGLKFSLNTFSPHNVIPSPH